MEVKTRKKHLLIISVLIFVANNCHCQLVKIDSLTIDQVGAVNLTDSLNSTIPTKAVKIIIVYLNKIDLNPQEYYTLKRLEPKLVNIKLGDGSIKEVYYINLLRIGALRAMVYGPIVEGSLGGTGDDINIAYDKEFKEVYYLGESQ